jgi:molybdate transport system substrate-binding protein
MPSRILIPLFVLAALAACSIPRAAARRISIAAASDLQFALEEVNDAFRAAHPGVTVEATYGASGTIFAQISNGAPYDLFFSADSSYPRRLAEAGLVDPESLFVYAVGRIVIWAPEGSPIDVAALGPRALEEPRVRRIAIANPEHAPYGQAAEAALRSLGSYDAVREKLVFGENTSQTAQFVESGAADIGIVSHAHVLAPRVRGKGSYWQIPIDLYPQIEQAAARTSRASDRADADAYLEFVRSDQGHRILERYGFTIPGR